MSLLPFYKCAMPAIKVFVMCTKQWLIVVDLDSGAIFFRKMLIWTIIFYLKYLVQDVNMSNIYEKSMSSGGSRISPRRGRQLPGGRQHTILPNFPKNCMKLKEFGPPGGARAPRTPLRSATDEDHGRRNCTFKFIYN